MEQPITNTTPVEAPASEAEATTLVKFSKPYKFEGQTYSEIDLSGMDSLTAEDMIAAEKHLMRTGVFSPLPEMTVEYVQFIAAQSLRPARRVLQGASPEGRHQGQKPGDQFFLRRGLTPEDGKDLRRLCVRLSMTLHSGFTDLMRMTIGDLVETTNEVIKISKEAAKRGKRK